MSETAVQEVNPGSQPDWGVQRPSYPVAHKAGLVALIVLPALCVALVLSVFTGWWWLGAVVAAAWAVKTAVEGWTRDPLMLKMLGARPLAAEEAPRLANIVTGLAGDLGMHPPRLYLIEDGGPNALVRKGGPGGTLAVTRGFLDAYTRTEQEAVVAHCLARMQRGDFVYSNLAARWSDLGAGLAPRVGTAEDGLAAAVTRYPPALQSALEKADARVKRYTPLWFAAASPSHDDTSARAAALADL